MYVSLSTTKPSLHRRLHFLFLFPDASGETTFFPFLPLSSVRTAEGEHAIESDSLKTFNVQMPKPSGGRGETQPLSSSSSSSARGAAARTPNLTGPPTGALLNLDVQYPVVKALKGLDVRLPPSIAALEEERIVEGISIDATQPPVVGLSPQASPSGGLFRGAAFAHCAPLQSTFAAFGGGVKASISLSSIRPVGSLDLSNTTTTTTGATRNSLHHHHNQHHQIHDHHHLQPSRFVETLVTGDEGETYYLMETGKEEEKESHEIYYVVSDVSQFL